MSIKLKEYLKDKSFDTIIDRNNIKPLLEIMVTRYICAKTSDFNEANLKPLKNKFTCRELVEFLDSNNIINFYSQPEWMDVRLKSKENLLFISRYFIKRLIKSNNTSIYDLNLIKWYEKQKWTDYTKIRAFFEYQLAGGGNLKIVPTSAQYVYNERKQEFYTTFEAVKSAGEMLESKHFMNFKYHVSDVDSKYVLSALEMENTLESYDENGVTNMFDVIAAALKVEFNPIIPQFWHGTAPFCDGNPGDCENVAGKFYKSVPNDQITAKDRESYGASCWSGNKVLCRYDPDAAIRSGIFQRAGVDPYTMNFEMKWFGTAPLCDPTNCEVWSEGFMPVQTDEYGDGSRCWTGRKILGIRPLSMSKEQQIKFEEQRKKCEEVLVMESEKQKEMIKGIFTTGAKVLGAL